MASPPKGELHGFCGRIAAGKSTLAERIARERRGILLCEDRLLAALYPNAITSLDDYSRATRRLRRAIDALLIDLLVGGICVVLDFQSNTRESRAWLKRMAERANVELIVHHLITSEETCRARLATRNAGGLHPYQVGEAEFAQFNALIEEPDGGEGLNLHLHGPD